MEPLAEPIPSFQLFGEQHSPDLAEMLHCETIAARSSRYRWEIAPHRHPALHQVLFVAPHTDSGSAGAGVADGLQPDNPAAGTVELVLRGQAQRVAAPLLAFVPAGMVHGFRFPAGAQGVVLTCAREYPLAFPAGDPLRRLMERGDLAQPDERNARALAQIGAELADAQARPSGMATASLRRALAEAFLRLCLLAEGDAATGGGHPLVLRFEELVEQHFAARRPLAFYAAQLGCTTRTLARLVQQQHGTSPLDFINRRVIAEARRLLRFSNATCTQVAGELGFDDASYFSRFYQRMTGERPSTGRQGDVTRRRW